MKLKIGLENKILALFDRSFLPSNKSHEKINAIFRAAFWDHAILTRCQMTNLGLNFECLLYFLKSDLKEVQFTQNALF